MGWAALGQCWATKAEAAAAVCGGFPHSDGSGVLACTGTAGDALQLTRTTGPGQAASFSAPIGGYPCDALTFAAAPVYVSPVDAAAIGAAVVSVLAAAYAWRALYRTLHDRDEV